MFFVIGIAFEVKVPSRILKVWGNMNYFPLWFIPSLLIVGLLLPK